MGSLLPDRIWLSLFCWWCKKILCPTADMGWWSPMTFMLLRRVEATNEFWLPVNALILLLCLGASDADMFHICQLFLTETIHKCRHRGFRDAACAWLHAQPGLRWWDLAWWNSDTNWFCIESTKRRIAIPGVFLSFSDFSQVRYIYFDTGNPAPVLTKTWHT